MTSPNIQCRGTAGIKIGLFALAVLIAMSARGFTTLYSFQLGPRMPQAGLIFGPNANLYVPTYSGGNYGYGTIVELTTGGQLNSFYSLNYSNGINPQYNLTSDESGNLYGVCYQGGSNGLGSIFKMTPDGTVSGLFSFAGTNGAFPQGGLIFNDSDLYGTTSAGGPAESGKSVGFGTVFKISTSGTGFKTLENFNFLNGSSPQGALARGADGDFYGTTAQGGYLSNGVVFKLKPNGTSSTLHSFEFSDGAVPYGGLVETNGVFYGTTSSGGNSSSNGTVFTITSNGVFSSLFSFNGFNGSNPQAGLLLTNATLFGTTYGGGVNGYGTVFAISPYGTLTTLVSFDYQNGANPEGALVTDGAGNLYGTTVNGGANGAGTVFKIGLDGYFTTLFSFNPEGGLPSTGVLVANGCVYGAVSYGGPSNSPTVFGINTNGALNMFLPLIGTNGGAVYGSLILLPNAITNTTVVTNISLTSSNISGPTNTATNITTNMIVVSTTSGPTNTGLTNTGSTNYTLVTNIASSQTTTNMSTNSLTNELPTATTIVTTNTLSITTLITNSTITTTISINTNTNQIIANGLETNIVIVSNTTSVYPMTYVMNLTTNVATTIIVQSNTPSLYGMTFNGGSSNLGAIFAVATNGGVTNILSFAATNGSHPLGGLVQGFDGNLYGTTTQGGPSDSGMAFRLIMTNGGGLTVITPFASNSFASGASPEGALIQAPNGNFYGTTYSGGASNLGTIFMLTSTGTLTNLISFAGNNGSYPESGLTWGTDSNFYGTTSGGGNNGAGTVFELEVTNSGNVTNYILTNIISFSKGNYGENPQGPLVQGPHGALYGTTQTGGPSNYGTVFCVNPSISTNITNVYAFDFATGAYPNGGLSFDANTNLYGATSQGGSYGAGTIFMLSQNEATNPSAIPDAPGAADPPSLLVTNGGGTIDHATWPSNLVNGRNYTVTAAPQPGYLFDGWTILSNSGSAPLAANARSYTFKMEANLSLEANFVPDQFLAGQGSYKGLFGPVTNAAREQTNSGSFQLTLTRAGTFTGALRIASDSAPLSGKFTPVGSVQVTNTMRDVGKLITTLQLNSTNQSITGWVSNAGFVVPLTSYQNAFDLAHKASYAGRYTLIIPGTNNVAVGPFGASYGTVVVAPSGKVSFSGTLADGTPVHQSSIVSQNGLWPMYINLYNGSGSVWCWNQFTNASITGDASWINRGNSNKGAALNSGFTNPAASIIGSVYTSSNLITNENPTFLLPGNLLNIGTSPLLKTNKTTGVITGTFVSVSNSQQKIKVGGVIIETQTNTNAQGYFISDDQSGSFSESP